jgi:hypothetical protein
MPCEYESYYSREGQLRDSDDSFLVQCTSPLKL